MHAHAFFFRFLFPLVARRCFLLSFLFFSLFFSFPFSVSVFYSVVSLFVLSVLVSLCIYTRILFYLDGVARHGRVQISSFFLSFIPFSFCFLSHLFLLLLSDVFLYVRVFCVSVGFGRIVIFLIFFV